MTNHLRAAGRSKATGPKLQSTNSLSATILLNQLATRQMLTDLYVTSPSTPHGMSSEYVPQQQWNSNTSRIMTDRIHAEVKSMVANSRLRRKSQGIALVHRQQLQVGELLGRGAFSEVHEVCVLNNADCNQRTRYAMKHLKSKLLTQSENFRLAAAELAVEAHMLASFDHPNVMKIRGWAVNGVASFADGRHDSFFLLLDRLDETLDQRIETWQKQGANRSHHQNSTGSIVTDLWRRFSIAPVTEDPTTQQQQQVTQRQEQLRVSQALHLEKIGVCIEIASALAYLHSQGVIFRDLKPNNIGFLNGHVQLFDFGLSRELPKLNLEEPFEMSGKVGTLRYMSPEVASHQVYNVSADVYSWAMVCYEIFVLEKPFQGWTRDMHSNLVCGRGARPDTAMLPANVKPMLEACWNQYAYRRPSMGAVEQKMKRIEEQQMLLVCGPRQQQQQQPLAPHVAVELPRDFKVGMRKLPNRNHSESLTTATVSMSAESLSEFMYP